MTPDAVLLQVARGRTEEAAEEEVEAVGKEAGDHGAQDLQGLLSIEGHQTDAAEVMLAAHLHIADLLSRFCSRWSVPMLWR